LVRSPEARFWVFRYTMPSAKMRELGLGRAGTGVGAATLAEARERAADLYRLVKAGIDPLAKREADAASAAAEAAAAVVRGRTFRELAGMFLASHEAGWRNPKHRQQWRNTLETYVDPHMGAVPVAEVGTAHVMAALEPIWAAKPETASRVRGRIEAVLDYAAAREWRRGENPARWRGHLAKLLPARGRVAKVEHHAALPWSEVPSFMRVLRQREGTAAQALELAVLTAARTGEVLGMRWSEIDWRCPG
jgi:integrase